MEITTKAWASGCLWLGRVRFLILTPFLVAVIVAVSQLAHHASPGEVRTLVPLIALWYTFAILFVILQRWLAEARWQARLQMVFCDLVIITDVVYATGAQDGFHFISLYLLA